MSTTRPLDKSSDRVREMFAQIASKYDLMNHLLSLNIDKYWRSATVKRVPISGTDPILDLCTGTGDLAFEFRKRLLAYRRLPVRGLRTTCVNQLIINRRDAQNHVVSRLPACPPACQPLQMLLCCSTKH